MSGGWGPGGISNLMRNNCHEVWGGPGLRPVLAALAGWLAVMYGIQHSLISAPRNDVKGWG